MLGKKIQIHDGVKASIAFFVASVISTGISYIVTPIYTRLLTTEQYGQTSIFMTWMSIFGIVAMFCLNRGVYNVGMMEYEDRRDEYAFSLLLLSNIITILFSFILFLLYPFVKTIIGIELPLIVLMIVVFLFQPAYNFWFSRQRYEYKYKQTFVWSLVSAFSSPLLAIILIFIFPHQRLYARIFGAEISLILIYIYFYHVIARNSKFKLNTAYWKPALKFNTPLIPHYLSSYVLSSSDKVMIGFLIGNTAAAYYSVAHSIAAIASIMWSAINGSLTPYVFEKCKIKDYESISKVSMGIVGIIACGCSFVILFAPEVLSIMATSSYKEAIFVIPPIVGGFFFQVMYYVFSSILYFYKRTTSVMIASLISTSLNVVLNYIFIQRNGYIAAGFTTLISYIIQALINYFSMKKVAGCDVYDLRFVIGYSCIILLLSIFGGLLYFNIWLRLVVIFILIMIVGLQRNQIFSLVHSLMKRNA